MQTFWSIMMDNIKMNDNNDDQVKEVTCGLICWPYANFLVNLQLWRVSKNLRTAPLKVLHCLYPHFSSQSHIIYYQKHLMGVKEDTKTRAERGGPSREGVLLCIGGISSLCDITKGWIPKLSVLTDTFWKEERAQEVEDGIFWFPFQAGDTSLSEKTEYWIVSKP